MKLQGLWPFYLILGNLYSFARLQTKRPFLRLKFSSNDLFFVAL